MAQELWINLPVKDVVKAREFYREIGFSLHPRHENDDNVCGLVFNGVMVMLFPETTFSGFTRNAISDPQKGTEVLFSLGADNREEVDAFASKAASAGGVVFGEPVEVQGWMYGCGFTDLDGHRWNILYMDHARVPQQ